MTTKKQQTRNEKIVRRMDNFDLIQQLYYVCKGGDEMPTKQATAFRLIYWELYNRFLDNSNGDDRTRKLIAENESRAKKYRLSEIVMGAIEEYDRMRADFGDEEAYNIALCNSTASLPASILDELEDQKENRNKNKLQEMVKDINKEYTDEELMEQAETNRHHREDILEMIRSRKE